MKKLTIEERSQISSEDFAKLANRSLLRNEFYIPLSSFNITAVPQKATIYYGKKEYNNIDNLIEDIYKSRSYKLTEESAKKRIENLLIKGMSNNTLVYGEKVSYKFDFIDASNYDIIV